MFAGPFGFEGKRKHSITWFWLPITDRKHTLVNHTGSVCPSSWNALHNVRRRSNMFVSLGFGSGRAQDALQSAALNKASANRSFNPSALKASGQNPSNSLLRSITMKSSLCTVSKERAQKHTWETLRRRPSIKDRYNFIYMCRCERSRGRARWR